MIHLTKLTKLTELNLDSRFIPDAAMPGLAALPVPSVVRNIALPQPMTILAGALPVALRRAQREWARR